VNEMDWLSSHDPFLMEQLLRRRRRPHRAGDRLWRLFACACCRRAWSLLADEGRRAVEYAEQFADGQSIQEEMVRAAEAAYMLGETMETDWRGVDAGSALLAAAAAAGAVPHAAWPGEPQLGTARTEEWNREWAARCPLLRDVFGNPFRSLSVFDPTWQTCNDGVVSRLAQAAYNERIMPQGTLDPARLGILADALEEAGASTEIIGHLRSPLPHVRGCFALDAILGKD
jgi:hypothetical protein